MSRTVKPSSHQKPLPESELLLHEAPDSENIEMDVVFVGGGPAGLAGAIELAKLAQADPELKDLQIAVLEKAEALGEHCLSGAVVNPVVFKELFPETEDADFPFSQKVPGDAVYFLTGARAQRIPTPPTMHNSGNYVASISEMVTWLGARAEELGVNVFPGFPVGSLLMDGDRVQGVRTVPTGLDRDGSETSNFMPHTDLVSKVTVLAEGTRGPLTQAYINRYQLHGDNPQIFALGVKELWETKKPLESVVHTLGWPLPRDAFGGSWMYPMSDNLVSLGLVVGLDYRETSLDVHELLQRMKLHPLFKQYLDGGELLEWGAKTIPEGGLHSMPQRMHGDGLVMVGDAVGFVNVPALKGIHYAMQSGVYAARVIFKALKSEDTSERGLQAYDNMVRESYLWDDLRKTRNMRLAFKDGFYKGGVKAALMTLTGGAFPGRKIEMEADADAPKEVVSGAPLTPDGKLTFSKVDAVFKSGNATRDTIPTHLDAADGITEDVARMYEHMCPAGVYEWVDGELRINAPNCVDCKATDVLGPRWSPREGGSGTKYKRM